MISLMASRLLNSLAIQLASIWALSLNVCSTRSTCSTCLTDTRTRTCKEDDLLAAYDFVGSGTMKESFRVAIALNDERSSRELLQDGVH